MASCHTDSQNLWTTYFANDVWSRYIWAQDFDTKLQTYMPSPSAIQLYFKSNFLLAILGGVLVVMLYFNVYEEGWG